MKKLLFLSVAFLFCTQIKAQVGINTTNPNATLDINATSVAAPSNEDGLLIPRVDNFPATSPTVLQDGMMVFATGNGTPTKGFYYWDNATTSWIGVSNTGGNTLDEAYDEGGAGAGRTITADNGAVQIEGNGGLRVESQNETHMLFVNGSTDRVGINRNNPLATLQIDGNMDGNGEAVLINAGDTQDGIAINLTGSSSTGTDNVDGININQDVDFTGSGARPSGISLTMNGSSTATNSSVRALDITYNGPSNYLGSLYGTYILDLSSADNTFYGNFVSAGSNGTNSTYGSYNSIGSTGTANIYGTYNTMSGTGTGNKYGSYNTINTGVSGTHYGVYSDVQNPTGYAGYFLGRTSLGTGTTNRYFMPPADGTSGQVMTTDGSGNVTFQNAPVGGVTLDGAYDFGGAGAGRTITADSGAVVIEGNGGLRVESTNETNMLRVDGANDAVGIGEASPVSPLHVGIQTTWNLSYANTGQDGLYLIGSGDNSGLNAIGASIGFGPPAATRSDQRKAAIASVQTGGDQDFLGLGFYIHGNPINQSPMVEGMRLSHEGFLGINNIDPSATLDVVGTMQFVDGNQATGYVLASDANGNANWTDPATIITDTDDQTIDAFSLVGTILNLSLEDDGQPNQTVNLSSLNTDDQTIDTFTLTGTNLNLSLEDDGQPLQTVDLSSLQDGTGTDDQTIDSFGLVGTILGISLEDDGQPVQTVDLSSLQDGTGTDDQTIDTFTLTGTNLNLSLEDDGQPVQTVDLSSLEDADWLNVIGDAIPTSNTDDIYTSGNVGIGTTSNSANLNITHNEASDGTEDWVISNTVSNSGNDNKIIIRNSFGSAQAGNNTAMYNLLIGNGSGIYRGVHNYSYASVTGEVYGVFNSFSPNGNGNHYGIRTNLTGSGTGTKYGTYNTIASTAGGTHYGIYSDVTKAGSYAGYFLGNVSIGTTTGNNYILPASRGANGQIMQTDAVGNVSWVTPATGESTTASNGLSLTGSDVRLGGTLIQNTTITQGVNSLDINLNSIGDFAVQDNGVDAFIVEDTGDVGIGLSNPNYKLDIEETNNTELRAVNITKTDNFVGSTFGIYNTKTAAGAGRSHAAYNTATSTGTGNNYAIYNLIDGSGTGQKYGVFNEIFSTATGNQYGTRNWVRGSTSAGQFGTFNNMDNGSTGDQYGVYNGMRSTAASQQRGVHNEFNTVVSASELTGVRNQMSNGTPGAEGMNGVYTQFSNSNNGNYFGSRTEFTTSATGTGNKYGTYNLISSTAGGTHYGTYNEVSTSNGWAGYFVGNNYVSGKVGVGTGATNPDGFVEIRASNSGTEPNLRLIHIGSSGSRIQFTNTGTTNGNTWTLFGNTDNVDANSVFNIFHDNAGNIVQIRGDGDFEVNGRVGVNVNNPTYAVELPNSATIGTGRGLANAWNTYSDGRVKSNQIELQEGLSTIMKIYPKSYFHHNSSFSNQELVLQEEGEKTIGFIAQELYKVLPEAVKKPVNENEALWSVDYDKVIPVAVKAIQELKEEVDTLKQKNQQLETLLSQYKNLETRLNALENKSPLNLTANN